MDTGKENFPSEQHRLLHVFAGKWNTIGETSDGSCLKINALDVYEWLPGRQFLLHRWDARIGEQYVSGLEIISFDASSGSYPMKFYDSEGNSGQYHLHITEDGWMINNGSERAFVRVDSHAGKMYANWQRLQDQTWSSWMKVELTRVEQRSMYANLS